MSRYHLVYRVVIMLFFGRILVMNRVLNCSINSSKVDIEFFGNLWNHLWAVFVRVVGKTRHMIASLTFYNIIFVWNIETCATGSPVPSYWSRGGSLNFVGIKVAIMLWTNEVLPSNMHSSISSGPVRALCNASRNCRLKLALLGKLDSDSWWIPVAYFYYPVVRLV